jgi:hypothetical protein
MGVFPTNAPSIQARAGEGVERNNNLLASLPARCSRAVRLTTSGGGPAGITRYNEPLRAAGLLGAGIIMDFSTVGVVAEIDVAPEYSAAACPLATPHAAARDTPTSTSLCKGPKAAAPKCLFIGQPEQPLS